jgi:hypothetical protein
MKKNIKWMITIIGILLLPYAIVVLYRSQASIKSLYNRISITTSTVSNHGDRKTVYYYSPGRPDRSGAIVHDMLFAHAYIYDTNQNQNDIYGVYGGCCGSRINSLNDTYQLLLDLHWNKILKFDCPPPISLQNRTTNDTTSTDIFDDDKYILLNPKLYRQYDVNIFKPEWRDYFIQLISVHTLQQKTNNSLSTTGNATSGSDVNENYEYNDRYTPSDAVALYNNNHEIVHDVPVLPIQYSIAVHIRRGDVNPCQYKERYLPNSHYLQLIQQYISILSSSSTTTTTKRTESLPTELMRENIAVTIYSESESLEIFQHYNFTLSLDDALSTVWLALSTAHVAILSKSSFSYVPAIINPNRVVYTPFRHGPMKQWDVVSDTIVSQSMVEVMSFHDNACNISSTR